MALPKLDSKPHAPTLVYAIVVIVAVVLVYHFLLKGKRRR